MTCFEGNEKEREREKNQKKKKKEKENLKWQKEIKKRQSRFVCVVDNEKRKYVCTARVSTNRKAALIV